jgi:hypothetical protein
MEIGHLEDLHVGQVTDDLADELVSHEADPPFRQAVVASVQTGDPPTYTITKSGTLIPGVPSIAGRAAQAGDSVFVLRNRNDWSIIGVADRRTWQVMSLAAGWSNNAGSNALACSVVDRETWLRGVVRTSDGAGAGDPIATLPAGARPPVTYQTVIPGGTTMPYPGIRVNVGADGVITLVPTLSAGGLLFFDLRAPIPLW